MLFPRLLTTRGRQDFVDLLLPHMPVLHAKALRWTGSAEQADSLLDDTLASLAEEMDGIRQTDNLRLWLVNRLYREYLAREELLDKEAIIEKFLGDEQWTASRPN